VIASLAFSQLAIPPKIEVDMRPTILPSLLALSIVAACGSATSPSGGVSGGPPGSGPVGSVTVGNIFFRSAHNGSQNPSQDTIAAGSTVTWTWVSTGSHSIQSPGTPFIFRNSVVMSAAGSTYAVTFNTPGTYTYDCGVHGSLMTGVIVVR
jgi:plastocyanin